MTGSSGDIPSGFAAEAEPLGADVKDAGAVAAGLEELDPGRSEALRSDARPFARSRSLWVKASSDSTVILQESRAASPATSPSRRVRGVPRQVKP
ncbi:MAG: hypothetical protein K2Q10_08015 [Rhodospirillales bacterium]|nr:hypothetical protein [Rhodospirillales bacterium]